MERVFSCETGVKVIALGLHVIRGDNIAVVGEIDTEKDSNTVWNNLHVRSSSPPYFFHHLDLATNVSTFLLVHGSDATPLSLQYNIRDIPSSQ